MAKTGKRAKRRMAAQRKKLGFVLTVSEGRPTVRFGSAQERQDTAGKACVLGTSRQNKRDKQAKRDKQKGWD